MEKIKEAEAGGMTAVASELGAGVWQEMRDHPLRLLGSAATGAATAIGTTLIAPKVLTGVAIAGIGYGGYQLYKHGGVWIDAAKMVARTEPDAAQSEAARATLRSLGAGATDVAAGIAGGMAAGSLRAALTSSAKTTNVITEGAKQTGKATGDTIASESGKTAANTSASETARTTATNEAVKTASAEAAKNSAPSPDLSLLNFQRRSESHFKLQAQAGDDLTIVSHSKAALPGHASGDLVKVAKTDSGKIVLTAMDVEGHGLTAAKRSVSLHRVLNKALSQADHKSASEVLAAVDKSMGGNDDLSVTAALAIYNPVNHQVQIATASSELAFVVRASGQVQQLDAKVGGFALGNSLYPILPHGHQSISLGPKDLVVMASDGAFDRFGYGNVSAFRNFLKQVGPRAQSIKQAILHKPIPTTGADDTSFIIFGRPQS
ncbi:MAG: serine/threonine-protein phosphatase [Candidatus Obscuribacter sp.]|nr:serine/threonine-protein phosphatase [Candidatus Obscuribacter sp.]